MKQCGNLLADRTLGEYWERKFCDMAAQRGFTFTPMQIGRDGSVSAYRRDGYDWKVLTLPDITIWNHPGQYHEIKHKNPTRYNSFGLEEYRYEALLSFAETTDQFVLYTIHNHDWAGGRNGRINDINHWLTVDVRLLQKEAHKSPGYSYINGHKLKTQILYWPMSYWISLQSFWRANNAN